MIDYIEQISFKFHIERFLIDNINEQYRFLNYIIELSKSDKYIHSHITDISAPKVHNRFIFVAPIHFYDFEPLLHIFKKAKQQSQKHY
jgi:hypothetical protein